MDPNANLRRQRELAELLLNDPGSDVTHNQVIDRALDHARELAELVEALDEWICRGGFVPGAWKDAIGRNSGRAR